jgi:hypothetical protein
LGHRQVDLDFFYLVYLVSFDGEELRVPAVAPILGFAIVEDEGFVAFFKQLLNAIGWGFLGVRPAPFEIGFTVQCDSLMDW